MKILSGFSALAIIASIISAAPIDTQNPSELEVVEPPNEVFFSEFDAAQTPVIVPPGYVDEWWAIYRQRFELKHAQYQQIMEALLEHGADVNGADDEGRTALHYAVWRLEKETVSRLLESGADVNAVDNIGQTALHWAASYGHSEIVMTLLSNGADVNARDNRGKTALINAASEGNWSPYWG